MYLRIDVCMYVCLMRVSNLGFTSSVGQYDLAKVEKRAAATKFISML